MLWIFTCPGVASPDAGVACIMHRCISSSTLAHSVGAASNLPMYHMLTTHFCLQTVLTQPVIKWSGLIDSRKPYTETFNVTCWDAGNELVSAFQELHSNCVQLSANATDLATTRPFVCMRNNAPANFFNCYKMIADGLTDHALQRVRKVQFIGLILVLVEVSVRAVDCWHAVSCALQHLR
jgi:hypothetical protein